MDHVSPLNLVKRLEGQLLSQLAPIDVLDLAAKDRALVLKLRRDIVDARLDVRDYELSETRQEQLDNAKEATKRLREVSQNILIASETDMFGPADVAQLTAQIEHTITNLR